MAHRRVRAYSGVSVRPSGVHPYAGVRAGCCSIGCLLIPAVFIGIPALIGAPVMAWH